MAGGGARGLGEIGAPGLGASIGRAAMLAAGLLGGAGCGDDGDCEAIRSATERESCRFEAVKAAGADQAAVEAALGRIPEGEARDLVRLRMAIERPSEGERWCGGVTTQIAREKCQQVLGRPHLRSGP